MKPNIIQNISSVLTVLGVIIVVVAAYNYSSMSKSLIGVQFMLLSYILYSDRNLKKAIAFIILSAISLFLSSADNSVVPPLMLTAGSIGLMLSAKFDRHDLVM